MSWISGLESRRPDELQLVTEADLQRLVTDAAELYGWSWAHFRPAQTARGWRTPVEGPIGAGFPDLILARPRDHRLLFVELKSDIGKISEQQRFVHDVLTEAYAPVWIVRPKSIDLFLDHLR
jgi:hypothetical protein